MTTNKNPEYTVLYRQRNTDEPLEPFEFDNYTSAKNYYETMKKDCPKEFYVQLNKFNKGQDMYDDIENTWE